MIIPKITSKYKLLFKPEKYGNYVNDHSIIKDENGNYHLFGITSFSTGSSNSYNEKYFVHAIGKSLDESMSEQNKVIDKGTLAWSPSVTYKDGYYYMHYGPSPTMLAVSFDLNEWFGTAMTIDNEPIMAIHRDHFVMKYKDGYLMYAVGVKEKRSSISVSFTKDLIHFQFVGYALTSGINSELNPPWGAFESPYVIEYNNLFYLFVTYTDCSKNNYNNTYVFVCDNPLNFGVYNGINGNGIKPITVLKAHAPEILKENGQYYITTCGWNGYGVINEGGVSIAKLEFVENK